MNVALFSNHLVEHKGHGISRYARELHHALAARQNGMTVMPVSSWKKTQIHDLQRLQKELGVQLLPWGKNATALAWTFLGRPHIESWIEHSVDVVHALALGYPVATRKPLVVTIHDIGPLTHPEYFSSDRPWLMKRSLLQAVKQAAAVICVSQATADEVQDYVNGALEGRVHVAHEGVEAGLFENPVAEALDSVKDMPPHAVPFVLAVGALSPRKNVGRVVAAMDRLHDVIPHHLVLAGGAGWDADEFLRDAGRARIADRVHLLGYVSDTQLQALYAAAAVCVLPSLYEGFGLPVLEAMAAGCPVITSNVSSLPEVAGDAALLVDPFDVDAIAEAIRTVCTDDRFDSELATRGRSRARMFTWDQCAEKVAAVYEAVATR